MENDEGLEELQRKYEAMLEFILKVGYTEDARPFWLAYLAFNPEDFSKKDPEFLAGFFRALSIPLAYMLSSSDDDAAAARRILHVKRMRTPKSIRRAAAAMKQIKEGSTVTEAVEHVTKAYHWEPRQVRKDLQKWRDYLKPFFRLP